MTHTFTLEQHVPALPDVVYYAFTNSPTMGEWFSDWAILTPVRAQTLYLYWDSGFQAMGRYTELERVNGSSLHGMMVHRRSAVRK